MRSWTVGFFWLGTIAVGFCSTDCSKIAGLSGCVDKCKFERQSALSIKGCNNASVSLSLSSLYHEHNISRAISIEVRDSESFILQGDGDSNEDSPTFHSELREVTLIVENVKKVFAKQKAFDQVVINAVFKNVGYLKLEEKSFASCWGTVWLFDVKNSSTVASTFSSSELVVWKENQFTYHNRPEVTPRQKFTLLYNLSSQVQDMETTIFAMLGLLGAIVLTLIILTAIIASKKQKDSSVENSEAPNMRKKRKTPVIKVSRITRAFGKPATNRDDKPPKPPKPPKSPNVSGTNTITTTAKRYQPVNNKSRPQHPVPIGYM